MSRLLGKPRMSFATLALAAALGCSGDRSDTEIRIPLGAGGVGFLPLMMMREHGLIEQHARAAGLEDLKVTWIDLGGPAVMNDALLSESVDFIAAGPPAFLTLWDRTRDSAQVAGVAAMASLPMYLNARAAHLSSLEDLTPQDKIAVTAVKVSIPAIIMQMYAVEKYGLEQADRFDKYTVTMTHADALVTMLAGSSEISAHFTSPPFHQREIKDPAIRTIMSSDDVMGGATTFTMLSTTARFRREHPAAYAAVLAALEDANAMIRADPAEAARVLIAADGGGGFSVDEIVAVLEDPDIEFTTTPQNLLKYATFMHSIGSIGNRPESWRELFFPEIHGAPGS
ncbi:MAG TPA: ABC transporter substrate-binding protein [Gammaproteobacteria bacterium]|jgi:NitT/TauT family transport system substrate-binding protein